MGPPLIRVIIFLIFVAIGLVIIMGVLLAGPASATTIAPRHDTARYCPRHHTLHHHTARHVAPPHSTDTAAQGPRWVPVLRARAIIEPDPIQRPSDVRSVSVGLTRDDAVVADSFRDRFEAIVGHSVPVDLVEALARRNISGGTK
jgi:hypothetical protein